MNQTASRWALLPVLLVVWLAPWLGGSVETWAMAVLYGALAVLFLAYPVGSALRKQFVGFLIVLLVLPIFAFLPIAWTGVPDWRSDLTRDFGIIFPATIAPQPWLTFDAYLGWVGGVAWIYWLAGQGWTREIRKPLAELFAVGMILLSIVGLIGYHTRHPLPFWRAQYVFGPFPNRNQTADLLSLTFILLVALLHMAIVKKSRIAPLWIAGLLVVGYGLVVNYSRAGIILPALGVAVYWCMTTVTMPSRNKLWIGISAVALVLALFLAFGGETLERFTSGEQSITSDFRQLIFRDTVAMTRQQPWFGLGLSSFPAVFPLFRNLSVIDHGIIHPESDWLWLASEIGWPGTVVILAAALWLVWRAFCGAVSRPHPLRLASAICGGLFVLHGFFDVSGHRFGTLFPACFLFALCWPGQSNARPFPVRYSYGIAAALALIAITWAFNLGTTPSWPSHSALADIKKSAAEHITHGRGAEAYAQTNAALAWAPLDWQLYYQRGTSRILQRKDWAESLRDYQRTNHLERSSPKTPENQGLAWLSSRPELAALPWTEALRRMDPEEANRKYASFLRLAAPYPRLHSQLVALAGNNVRRSITLLSAAEGGEFSRLLTAFLKKHTLLERLAPADQRALFDTWAEKGDTATLIRVLETTPGLLPNCNLSLATAYAAQKNFQRATQIALQTVPEARIPQINLPGPEADLSRNFYTQNSLSAGIALYQSQKKRGDIPAALTTIEYLGTLPNAPLSVRYLEGNLRSSLGQWEAAWLCLHDYIIRSHL